MTTNLRRFATMLGKAAAEKRAFTPPAIGTMHQGHPIRGYQPWYPGIPAQSGPGIFNMPQPPPYVPLNRPAVPAGYPGSGPNPGAGNTANYGYGPVHGLPRFAQNWGSPGDEFADSESTQQARRLMLDNHRRGLSTNPSNPSMAHTLGPSNGSTIVQRSMQAPTTEPAAELPISNTGPGAAGGGAGGTPRPTGTRRPTGGGTSGGGSQSE